VEDTGDSLRGEATSVSSERWHEIASSPEFARVQALRRRITLGTLGIFGVAFGTFLVLCGYARPFMRRSVDGAVKSRSRGTKSPRRGVPAAAYARWD
jgi:hypothetical protein